MPIIAHQLHYWTWLNNRCRAFFIFTFIVLTPQCELLKQAEQGTLVCEDEAEAPPTSSPPIVSAPPPPPSQPPPSQPLTKLAAKPTENAGRHQLGSTVI